MMLAFWGLLLCNGYAFSLPIATQGAKLNEPLESPLVVEPRMPDRAASAHPPLMRKQPQLMLEEEWATSLAGRHPELGISDRCVLPSGARWCRARSGDMTWQMAVYKKNDAVSTDICNRGFWENRNPQDMGLPDTLSPDAVLLDVGAHVGWYTLMFAKHGHSVVAVEPMMTNRALMAVTLCANPDLRDRVHIKNAALADHVSLTEKCSIFSADVNYGNGILACNEHEIKRLLSQHVYHHIEREKVPLTTLDALLKEQKRIDVIKMDVEGKECNVLAGGKNLLSRAQPGYLMIETRLNDTMECTVGNVTSAGWYGLHKASFAGKTMSYDEMTKDWVKQGIATDTIFFAG